MISYALPALTGRACRAAPTRLGLAAFWLMVGGMFGMTMAMAAAGHHADLPRAHPGLRLSRDAAEDPGALLDVAGYRGGLRAGRRSPSLGLRRARAPRRGSRREEGVTRAARFASGAGARAATDGARARRRTEPYYRPPQDELAMFTRRPRPSAADHAQGTDRLRQDPLRSPHGVAARSAARDRRLSRRSLCLAI